MKMIIAFVAFSLAATTAFPDQADVSVCFTPAQACEGRIVSVIDKAKSEIRVQAYGFTSIPIIHALQRAAQRGVDVQALLDKVNDKRYSGATLLERAGIPVWIDYQPAIAHNKVIVIDRREVVGGSFNYTKAAETRNAENVTFITSAAVAARFLENWESRFKVSTPFGE